MVAAIGTYHDSETRRKRINSDMGRCCFRVRQYTQLGGSANANVAQDTQMTKPKFPPFIVPDGYVTVGEAARLLGITENAILERIRLGKLPNAAKNGTRWVIPSADVALPKLPDVDLNEYATAEEAQEYLGVSRSLICGLCTRGVFQHAHKREDHRWYIAFSDIEDYEKRFTPHAIPRTIEIDGEQFLSVREAHIRTGVHYITLMSRMQNGGYRTAQQVQGFWFASEEEVMSDYVRRPRIPETLEVDGVVYVTAPEAARILGVTEDTARKRARDGITFEDVREIDGCYYIAVEEVYDNCHPDALSEEGYAPHPVAIPRVREPNDERLLLSMPEVALRLDVGLQTAHYRRKRGLYPSAEVIRRHWYINESDLYNGHNA